MNEEKRFKIQPECNIEINVSLLLQKRDKVSSHLTDLFHIKILTQYLKKIATVYYKTSITL